MAPTHGSAEQPPRRSTRRRRNPIGLLVIAAILVVGGVLLYLNGPQLGPYRMPPAHQTTPIAPATPAQ